MSDCRFCQIVAGKASVESVVFEDDRVMAFPTIQPVSKGHTLLVPKTHCEDLFSISDDDAAAIGVAAAHLSRKLRDYNKATGLNLLQASGKDAQQSVAHLHFHLVPRYPDDGLDLWLREGL